jgi:hypothetical protein
VSWAAGIGDEVKVWLLALLHCRLPPFAQNAEGWGTLIFKSRSVESMNCYRLGLLRTFSYRTYNLAPHFRGADGDLGGFR